MNLNNLPSPDDFLNGLDSSPQTRDRHAATMLDDLQVAAERMHQENDGGFRPNHIVTSRAIWEKFEEAFEETVA